MIHHFQELKGGLKRNNIKEPCVFNVINNIIIIYNTIYFTDIEDEYAILL